MCLRRAVIDADGVGLPSGGLGGISNDHIRVVQARARCQRMTCSVFLSKK